MDETEDTRKPQEPESTRKTKELLPGFTVRLSTDYDSYGGEIDDPRRAFWAHCLENNEFTEEQIREIERELARRFSNALINEAASFRYARQPSSDLHPRMAFTFKFENLRYGSLLFDVSILGIGPFMSFFFNNPDVVSAFLELAVPEAVSEAIPYAMRGSRPGCAVYPNTALEAAFKSVEGNDGQSQSDIPMSGWAKVFQLSTRIPFFIPLILSLVVLYVAASFVSGERDRISLRETRLDSREARLDDREKDIRSGIEDRTGKLETLTLELVKQLRAEKPSPASDAAAKNAPHPASSSP